MRKMLLLLCFLTVLAQADRGDKAYIWDFDGISVGQKVSTVPWASEDAKKSTGSHLAAFTYPGKPQFEYTQGIIIKIHGQSVRSKETNAVIRVGDTVERVNQSIGKADRIQKHTQGNGYAYYYSPSGLYLNFFDDRVAQISVTGNSKLLKGK